MYPSSLPVSTYLKFHHNAWHTIKDTVSQEISVHLVWPDTQTTLWTFPHHLNELIQGHALIEWCSPDQIPVVNHVDEASHTYHLLPCPWPQNRPRAAVAPLQPQDIISAMNHFLTWPGLWEQTGCFHRMALLDPHTNLLIHFVEDIARHNCIDRLAGWSLHSSLPLQGLVLLCSSRITGSLMRKIVRTGLPMVISQSATTVAAIELAQHHKRTLLGFTRDKRFTIFHLPDNQTHVAMT
ncbi:MAG: hypothetical protein CSA21_02220 [Deltaproteobacteria bacterium]|nr:MAG: hypothetical protein CSA21_02220 [Deltaproteobacteria bacterium]